MSIRHQPTGPLGLRLPLSLSRRIGDRRALRVRRTARAAAEWLEVRRLLATITVTTIADETVTNDAPLVSLREAIISMNNQADTGADVTANRVGTYASLPGGTPDVINFNIPGAGVQTINLGSSLPSINKPVTIDGYSQPSASANTLAVGDNAVLLIELNGTGAGADVSGLIITAGNSTVRGLVINRFTGSGIELRTNGGDTIAGNYIGTNASGAGALSNGLNGVLIPESVKDNTIGGINPAARNIISGNKAEGVNIIDIGTTGNVVEGNYIGTDATGSLPLGNGGDGVGVGLGATANTIGGTAAGAENVISGNTSDGVHINDVGTGNNLVEGNFIGTNAAGTGKLPNNGRAGVEVGPAASTFNTIGGTVPGAGNVISGNAGSGVEIRASNNTVAGNYIGTDATGSTNLGNGSFGVSIAGIQDIVGGATAGAGNVISANAATGVYLGLNSSLCTVQGNFIGTDASGTLPLPNLVAGIFVDNNNSDDLIGGPLPAEGNTIAFNKFRGVNVFQNVPGVTNNSTNIVIRHNSIFSNGVLGIDLNGDGVTPNSPGSPHTGANNLQSFPVLGSATSGASNITIQGGLNSTANSLFVIDFYANPAPDPSGLGQGKTYVGSTVVATDAGGDAVFSATFAAPGLAGQYLSATATTLANAPYGDTSEFAQDIQISAPTPPADQPLAATGVPSVSATEGVPFSGLLARFSDADAGAVPGDFAATVNWGDGTTTAGTVTTDAGGGFDVSGTHTFTEEGNSPISISIKDTTGRGDTGGSTASASTSATVADATLNAAGVNFTGKEGRTFSGTVANFTDAYAAAPLGDFSASINWGDSVTTTGTVVPDGGGAFHVTGSHAYAEENTAGYHVSVAIHDIGGANASANATGKIAESPLDQLAGKTFTVSANTSFSNKLLGTFRDQDALNTDGRDYSATIHWGDGTTSTPKISFNGGTPNVGSFWNVFGSHKYVTKKTYTVTINLHDLGSPLTNYIITSFIKVV